MLTLPEIEELERIFAKRDIPLAEWAILSERFPALLASAREAIELRRVVETMERIIIADLDGCNPVSMGDGLALVKDRASDMTLQPNGVYAKCVHSFPTTAAAAKAVIAWEDAQKEAADAK
jgi:hypothetical protein